MKLTPDQLTTVRGKIEHEIRANLFAPVDTFIEHLKTIIAEPAFISDVDTSIHSVYDYAVHYSVSPKKTSIDVAIKFTADGDFYYFPLVVVYE